MSAHCTHWVEGFEQCCGCGLVIAYDDWSDCYPEGKK